MKTLEVDSLIPPSSFGEGLPAHQVAHVGVRGAEYGALRPYAEVAVLLVVAGVFQDIPSIQQIVDIEKCALRKLRRRPEIRRLFRDRIGKDPALA